MTIERTVEILPDHRLVLDLPLTLPVGRAKVALTVTPEKSKVAIGGKSSFGCLHQFADSSKISDEKNAWVQAVLGKYAKN